MSRMRDSVVFKSIFGIVLLLVVYSVVVSIIGIRNFSEVMLEQYADGAFRTANTAAYVFNPDDLDDFLATKCQSGEAKEAVFREKRERRIVQDQPRDVYRAAEGGRHAAVRRAGDG